LVLVSHFLALYSAHTTVHPLWSATLSTGISPECSAPPPPPAHKYCLPSDAYGKNQYVSCELRVRKIWNGKWFVSKCRDWTSRMWKKFVTPATRTSSSRSITKSLSESLLWLPVKHARQQNYVFCVRNKGNVRIKVTFRRVRVTIVGMERR
jgi:hypothetical protein